MLYPFNDKIGFVSLIDRMMIDPALKVVNSARISYNKQKDKFDEKDKKLIGFLLNEPHTSPFRHSFFTFHIKLPLFVARQWQKYQVGSVWREYELSTTSPNPTVSVDFFDILFDIDKGCSWNEISGRYTQTSTDFYFPSQLRSNPPHGNKQSSGEFVNPLHTHDVNYLEDKDIINYLKESAEKALQSYNTLIKNGVAKEIARMILPQNIYTEVYWTVSLQSVLHYLSQRLHNHAQFEIRKYAECIFELLRSDLEKIGITSHEEIQL